jgi:hypothetical protein
VYAPDAHVQHLTRCRVDAEPIAVDIRDALERRALPESEDEHSLLAAVDVMATFGCALADHAYRVGATSTAHRDAVRWSVSAYVIGSAIVDHICDHAQRLLPLLNERLSASALAGVLGGGDDPPPLAADGDPALLLYLDELFARAVRLCRSLVIAPRDDADTQWQAFLADVTSAYRAELATAAPGAVRQVETIWATPFWLALALVAAGPEARAEVDFDAIRAEARSFARLLALIDDIVDVEQDWASGAGNQLLERAARRPAEIAPWPALADAAVYGPYMDEITRGARTLSAGVDRDSLAAWLYYWLGP